MKSLMKCGLVLLVASLMAGTVLGQAKVRKLPESAYIKSAKIAIDYGESGSVEQFASADAMLDSLFMFYGPLAEGLFLKARIQKDLLDKASNLKVKREHVIKMAAYRDSLKLCCASPTIKPKYKDGCDKFQPTIDSLIVLNWRIFFNESVAQSNRVDEAAKSLETETDSTAKDFTQKKLDATIDSCIDNLTLAIILDSSDFRPYVALGNLYQQKKDFAEASKWMNKAVPMAQEKDRPPLLIQMAYNYIQQNQYCEAIPYFKQYLTLTPSDTTNLFNLAVCYNNCKLFDSAQQVYHQVLQLDPNNSGALVGIGRFFNEKAIQASDSVKVYASASDQTDAKKWEAAQSRAFDSSHVYFKKAFESNNNDDFAAEEYGAVAYNKGVYSEAIVPFKQLTEKHPENADFWTSLGDCYLNLKQFKEATAAYEKVVEIDPSNRQIWQRLSDLYRDTSQPAKQAEAEKHLK